MSVTEQRWLLEQLLRRQHPESAAVVVAAQSEEASGMIVRPAIHVAEGSSTPEDPTVSPIVPGRTAVRGAGPAAAPGRSVETGAEPSGVPAPPARPAGRTHAPARPAPPPSPTRRAPRAAPRVEHEKYRAVFACCCTRQAGSAPTEQSSSS